MVTIKKPNKKPVMNPTGNKPVKPKPFANDEAQNEVIEQQIQKEPDSEQEQQSELQEYQEEATPVEQQSVSLESHSEATQPKHSIADESEVTVEDKAMASTVVDKNRIDWKEKLKQIVPKQKVGFTETEGAVTAVNDRNSKRVKLKRVVTEGLGSPDYIKFYVTDKEFVVQASTADEEGSYKLRLEGNRNKCLIYNSEIIGLLTEMFELDFTKSTSQTFGEVKIECIDDVEYAVIFKEG